MHTTSFVVGGIPINALTAREVGDRALRQEALVRIGFATYVKDLAKHRSHDLGVVIAAASNSHPLYYLSAHGGTINGRWTVDAINSRPSEKCVYLQTVLDKHHDAGSWLIESCNWGPYPLSSKNWVPHRIVTNIPCLYPLDLINSIPDNQERGSMHPSHLTNAHYAFELVGANGQAKRDEGNSILLKLLQDIEEFEKKARVEDKKLQKEMWAHEGWGNIPF